MKYIPAKEGSGCWSVLYSLTLGLVAASALLLAPSQARAANECGAPTGTAPSRTATCTTTHYGSGFNNGIQYLNQDGLTLSVPGAATAWSVNTGTGNNGSGIVLDSDNPGTSDTNPRNLALTVGGASATANQVAITMRASPPANAGWNNHGIKVNQQGRGTSSTTVTTHAGVTIGTSSTARMMRSGIHADVWLGSGEATIDNAATIYSTGAGIYLQRGGAADTTEATTITNSGDITAANMGLQLRYFAGDGTNDGGAKIENTGAIVKDASGWHGAIDLEYQGTGDAEVDNKGTVTATHDSASTPVALTSGYGIRLRYLVNSEQLGDGAATIKNTHAVMSTHDVLRLENNGVGAATIENSGALTATGTSGERRGIWLEDRGTTTIAGGTTTVATVTNSGAITANEGIAVFVHNKNIAGDNVGIKITHSDGAIVASGGLGIKGTIGENDDTASANTGDIEIAVTGGSVQSSAHVLHAEHRQAGNIDIDVDEGVTLTSTSTTAGRGIFAEHHGQAGDIDIDVDEGVTLTSTADHVIYAHLLAANVTGGVTINNAGAITGEKAGIFVQRRASTGAGNISVTNSGRIKKTGATNWHGILINDWGTGDITVTNSGDIGEPEMKHGAGIVAEKSAGATTGDITVTNSGDIMAKDFGIYPLDNAAHTGTVTVTNSGDITAEHGIRVARSGSGAVSVTNSGGTVMGETEPGIRAQNKVGDASGVTVDVSGGTVRSTGQSKPAIHARQRGTGRLTVNVLEGASLISKHNAGIFAPLGNGNWVRVTQGGEILGRKGVYVQVAASATAETVIPRAVPTMIDINWSGTFAAGTTAQTAPNDNNRFVAATAASAVAIAQEVVTEQITENTIRYGSPAGIEAQVMSWREVMREVAKGDDLGAIADAPAQAMRIDFDSTDADVKARSDLIVAQFKAALGNDDIAVAEEVFDAIKTGATSLNDVTDAEIAAYLETTDDVPTRTLLRNIQAQSFTEAEKDVLRAVAVGDTAALTTALDNADAGFSDDYKTAVRALLDRYNVGNIRVNMTGGSIDSRGDGIRAYYATPHANNGRIDVTVGKGASVTGAVAGIYVANAGSDGVRVMNEGMIRGREVGIEVTGVRTVTTSGMSRSNAANVGSGGVRVVNRGRIEGPVGIQVPAASTVENHGTISSTAGANGILIDFQGTGRSVVTMYRGAVATGTIQLDGRDGDLVDLSDMYIGDVNVKIERKDIVDRNGRRVDLGDNFKDKARERPVTERPVTERPVTERPVTEQPVTERPVTERPVTEQPVIKVPKMMRPGDNFLMGTTASGEVRMTNVNTSEFTLTDDMLSDLTGSIHGAIVETQTGTRPGAASAGGQVVWATPFGGARDQNGSNRAFDATHYFGGGLVGTSWGAQDLRVGGFLGGSVGSLDVGENQSGATNVDMQTIFGGLVASRTLDTVLYDARLLFGHVTHDSTRRVTGDTAEVEYSSLFFSPEVGVATDVAVMSRLHVLPRLRVRYAGLVTEGFREHKGMWDVQYEKRTMHLVEGRAEVGVPVALENGGQIHPRVGVEGRWLLAGSDIKGTARGLPFNLEAGGDDAVFTGTVGVGVSVPVAEATTLVGSFDGALTTEEAWRALGYLGLTYSF